jgi:tetratricopeptide (TPR) repeat protein
MATFLVTPERPGVVRGNGHIYLANIAAARGRWNQAKQSLRAARSFCETRALEHEAIIALAPFLRVPENDLREIREELQQAELAPCENLPWEYELPDSFHEILRAYLLGSLEARLGDHEAARIHASELESIPGIPYAESLSMDFALSIRALIAELEGHEEVALTLLEKLRMETLPRQFLYSTFSPFFFRSLERYRRAELLLRLGRPEQALGWYEGLAWVSSHGVQEFVYLAPAYRRLGEIHQRLGRPERAAEYLLRADKRWNECDPILRHGSES